LQYSSTLCPAAQQNGKKLALPQDIYQNFIKHQINSEISPGLIVRRGNKYNYVDYYFTHPEEGARVEYIYMHLHSTSNNGWKYLRNHDLYFLCEDEGNEWRYHYTDEWINEQNDVLYGSQVSEQRTAMLPLSVVKKMLQCHNFSMKYGHESGKIKFNKYNLENACTYKLLKEIDQKYNSSPVESSLESRSI